MIIKQSLRLSSLLWVILLLPEAGISEDLLIPIEWYYGRWPSGHAAEGHFRVSSDKIQFGDGYSAYTYSNGKIRAGVNGFADYLLFSDNLDFFGTADATFGYRPSRNWQISLNSLEYSSRTSRWTSPPPNPFTSSGNSKRLDASASIDWSNKTDVQVSAPWQRYMEYVDSTAGQGQWLSRLSINSSLNSSNSSFHRIDSISIRSTSSTSSRNEWFFNYSALGTISDYWHLSLSVGDNLRVNSFEWMQATERIGNRSVLQRNNEVTEMRPQYQIRNIFNLTEIAFLEFSVSQRFLEIDFVAEEKDITADTIVVRPSRLGRGRTFQERQTNLGARMDIITKGDFVPSIVLDDYAGYYHQMLFAGQYHGQFEYAYSRSGLAGRRNSERVILRHSSRFGLTDKINVLGSINYNWQNSGSGWANLSPVLDLQWRSYDYQPGSGPGWYNDSPFDIQYGPIKRPGHFFLSVSTTLPNWHSHSGPEFLSFSGFSSDKNWQIKSNLSAGLPWQSELRATSTLWVLPDQTDRQNIDASLVKRLGGRFELSADYSNHARFDSDFQFTFSLRGFL